MSAIDIDKLIVDEHNINIENFKIEENEKVGIYGLNEKQRRAFLLSVLGVKKCRVRKVKVLDQDINKKKLSVMADIGIVFKSMLDPSMKLKTIFNMHGSYFNSLNKPRIEDVMQRFYLYQFREIRYKKLNPFIRSKTWIAISVLNNPSMLVFDGIFDGLDRESSSEIKEIIKMESVNRTLILGSDNLEDLFDICGQIYEFREGRINAIYRDKE